MYILVGFYSRQHKSTVTVAYGTICCAAMSAIPGDSLDKLMT